MLGNNNSLIHKDMGSSSSNLRNFNKIINNKTLAKRSER